MPFAFGCTIESLEAESTDSLWNPKFTKEFQDFAFKIVKLNQFAIYMNNNENPAKDFISRMTNIDNMSKVMKQAVCCNFC